MMSKLPWPNDAIMVVASSPEDAAVHRMTGEPMEENCRRCGDAVLVGSWTIAYASQKGDGKWPVKFFCVDCGVLHSMNDLELLVDHRPDESRVLIGKEDCFE